jgi:hypothetical protein
MLQVVQQVQVVVAAAVAVRHPHRRALCYSLKVQEERLVQSSELLTRTNGQTQLADTQTTTPCNLQETISPDTILQHYVNVARRLTANRQNLAASPCPSPGLTSTNAIPKKVETIGEPALVQAQAPPRPAALDWPPPQWTLLTLDELPDSETWSLPEYQLTQEWFEQTIRSLNDLEEEKRVEEEIKVDIGADMDVDTSILSHVGEEE